MFYLVNINSPAGNYQKYESCLWQYAAARVAVVLVGILKCFSPDEPQRHVPTGTKKYLFITLMKKGTNA